MSPMPVITPTPLTMRHLIDTPENRRDVAEIIMAAEAFSWLTEGCAPSMASVDDFFTAMPPGIAPKDKHGMGFYADGQIVGIADILHGWNAPHKLHIGLLLIRPKFHRRGYGRAACDYIDAFARRLGATVERIAVIANNQSAFAFWESIGFVRNGEIKPRMPPYTDNIVMLEKSLL
jgi:ribosomal protein S18 acetylase RimI-like enzyme